MSSSNAALKKGELNDNMKYAFISPSPKILEQNKEIIDYCCTECPLTPYINHIGIDSNLINFQCNKHGNRNLQLKNYYEQEVKQFKEKKIHEGENKRNDVKQSELEADIGYLKDKLKEFKDKQEELGYLILITNNILAAYNTLPNVSYHNINVKNVAKSFRSQTFNVVESSSEDINKIEKRFTDLQDKLLEIVNEKLKLKLQFKLTLDLDKINLSGKGITDDIFKIFSLIHFKNLEYLNLSNNEITDLEPVRNFNLPNIININMSHNKIDNISETLRNNNVQENMPNLENICLFGNQISVEAST